MAETKTSSKSKSDASDKEESYPAPEPGIPLPGDPPPGVPHPVVGGFVGNNTMIGTTGVRPEELAATQQGEAPQYEPENNKFQRPEAAEAASK